MKTQYSKIFFAVWAIHHWRTIIFLALFSSSLFVGLPSVYASKDQQIELIDVVEDLEDVTKEISSAQKSPINNFSCDDETPASIQLQAVNKVLNISFSNLNFLSNDPLIYIKTTIMSKFLQANNAFSSDIKLWKGTQNIVDLTRPISSTFANDDTVIFTIVKNSRPPQTVASVYDSDVAETLREHLTHIEDVVTQDSSQVVLIGLGSCNFSGDSNQQFPRALREMVARTSTPVTIMLIDGGFAKSTNDHLQIYSNGAFGVPKSHWHFTAEEANGKVRTFVNESDFGAKVTIRVYGTDILSDEWNATAIEDSATLVGNIKLYDMQVKLKSINKVLLVGDFHRQPAFPDILGGFKELDSLRAGSIQPSTDSVGNSPE